MPLIKVVGHTHIMNEKSNLFSSFFVKILRKLALKVAIFDRQTDRQCYLIQVASIGPSTYDSYVGT